jgi:beta-glucosidase
VSPSGRMPFAVPTDHDHLPPFDPRAHVITYDLWHGYRRLRRDGHAAAFPFGFGLSYAAFKHSDLTAETVGNSGESAGLRVAMTVRNVGAMAADEVIQVYAEVPARTVERPRRMLVAFQRLHLKPGQERRLALLVPLRRLALFDEALDAFVVEGGRHRLLVARHEEDDGIGVDVELKAAIVGP